MKRLSLAVLVLAVLAAVLCGCILAEIRLTPEEQARADAITARQIAAIEKGLQASADYRALFDASAELVIRNEKLAQDIAALAEEIRSGRLPAESGAALAVSLMKAKADVEANLPGLISLRDKAQAGVDEAKAEELAAIADGKALEAQVRERYKNEGINPLWGIVAGALALLSGGKALLLYNTACKVRDEARAWKESFGVVSTAISSDEKTGKASPEIRAAINKALAAAGISDRELEARRLAVRESD